MDFAQMLKETLNCGWAVATGAVVFAIGAFHVVKFLYALCRFFFRLLLPPFQFKRFGQWVVVTGATDGIGKAFCTEFAKYGLNVCLLSRTESRLVEVATELQTTYSVQTKHLAVDFSAATAEKWGQIKGLLEELEVGILVNNVGCSYEYPEYFHLIDTNTIDQLVELNVRATTKMTHLVLPGMLKRNKGVVLNIGSGVGSLLPSGPLLAVYAGTKAFVEQFTKSCNTEYKDSGIVFQDQAPLFVSTKMSRIRRTSLTVPSPQAWAKGALRQVGNGPLTAGYFVHNVAWGIISCLPESLLNAYSMIAHKSIRARALKKKAERAKKE